MPRSRWSPRLGRLFPARKPAPPPFDSWRPQVQQPQFKHKRRQTVGAVWSTFTPVAAVVPDHIPPQPAEPLRRHPPRQTAGAVVPLGIPPSIFVSTESTQVFADRVVIYKAKAEGFVPIVPPAVPDLVPPQILPIIRRRPRAQQEAFKWNPSTPLAPDVDWQPLTSQPLFRHKRRQSAGATWNPNTPLLPDVTWQPLPQQPLFRHKRRQAAGEVKPRSIPPIDILDIDWLPLVNQPYLVHPPRQTAGLTWNPNTPLSDFAWNPLPNVPYRIHPPRQTAGEAARPAAAPPLAPDVDWKPLTSQPLFRHKRRQGRQLAWNTETPPPPVPIDIDWITPPSQPYLVHPPRQSAGARAPILVPPPDFAVFQEPQIVRAILPRQTAGGVWIPETPLARDVEWQPLANQPFFRHKRRQTAGLSWHTDTPPPPPAFDPLARVLTNQPYLKHKRRQTAGATLADVICPPQTARPDGDIAANNWTTTPLWQKIDETPPSDADFIRSPNSPVNEMCEVSVEPLVDPETALAHNIRYRYQKDSAGARIIDLTIRLMQGVTTIATWVHSDIPVGFVTSEQTLTAGQANSITDYTDLRIQFEANNPSGGGPAKWAEVSWAEFEVPCADAAEPTPEWQPLVSQPLFRHPPRQTAGGVWIASTPLTPDVTWQPSVNQPLFKLSPRQTAGMYWTVDIPPAPAVPDFIPQLPQIQLNRRRPRQTAGEIKPRSIPPTDILDIDWLPLVNQPLFRLGARQTAGGVWVALTPLPDDWSPQANQPLFKLAPRQTAGLIRPELVIPPPVVPDFMFQQQPVLVRRRRVAIQFAYFSRIPLGAPRAAIVDLILDATPELILEVTPLGIELILDATPEETLDME